MAAIEDTNTANVVGIVLDIQTNTPISGSSITVTNSDDLIATFSTDEEGRFQIANMPEGTYKSKGVLP